MCVQGDVTVLLFGAPAPARTLPGLQPRSHSLLVAVDSTQVPAFPTVPGATWGSAFCGIPDDMAPGLGSFRITEPLPTPWPWHRPPGAGMSHSWNRAAPRGSPP